MWAVNAEQKEMLWPRPALLLLLVNNKEDPAVAEQKKNRSFVTFTGRDCTYQSTDSKNSIN